VTSFVPPPRSRPGRVRQQFGDRELIQIARHGDLGLDSTLTQTARSAWRDVREITVTGDLDEFASPNCWRTTLRSTPSAWVTKLVTGYMPPGFVFKLSPSKTPRRCDPSRNVRSVIIERREQRRYRLFVDDVAVKEFGP